MVQANYYCTEFGEMRQMSKLWFRVHKLKVQQKAQAKHKTIKQQMSLKGVNGLPRRFKGQTRLAEDIPARADYSALLYSFLVN